MPFGPPGSTLAAEVGDCNMADKYANCPDHLKPQMLMFLSADIVGSTALKQSAPDGTSTLHVPGEQQWFSVIQGFYIKAVQSFVGCWTSAREGERRNKDTLFGDVPLLWKTIGDEIVFRKTISHHRQVATTIECWKTAVAAIREFLRNKDPRLDVKCTAWIAEFPVQNKMVIGPTGEIADQLDPNNLTTVGLILDQHFSDPARTVFRLDFVGPAIDVGFRLASLATSRKFIISIDVAYLLSLSMRAPAPKVFYDGMTYLKGVLGGLEYPVFWIDMSISDSIDKAEDKLISRQECDRDDMISFCNTFYHERCDYITPPFILGDTELDLADAPPWYADAHGAIVDQYS